MAWFWKRKKKYPQETLSQCPFVQDKYQMDWPVIEPSLPYWEAAWSKSGSSLNTKTQVVPRSKHTPSQLWKPIS